MKRVRANLDKNLYVTDLASFPASTSNPSRIEIAIKIDKRRPKSGAPKQRIATPRQQSNWQTLTRKPLNRGSLHLNRKNARRYKGFAIPLLPGTVLNLSFGPREAVSKRVGPTMLNSAQDARIKDSPSQLRKNATMTRDATMLRIAWSLIDRYSAVAGGEIYVNGERLFSISG